MLYTNEAISKRKKITNKIIDKTRLLIYIIVIPLIIYNLFIIVQSIANPNETPSFFGFKTYIIISGSMQPDLKIGDIVIVQEKDKVEVNDVISFRQGEAIVTHRITSIAEENGEVVYKTKGDANNTEDIGVVKDSSIEGVVVGSIPYLGNIVLAFKNIAVIVVALLLAYVYIIYTGNLKKKKMERNIKRVNYEVENEIK